MKTIGSAPQAREGQLISPNVIGANPDVACAIAMMAGNGASAVFFRELHPRNEWRQRRPVANPEPEEHDAPQK